MATSHAGYTYPAISLHHPVHHRIPTCLSLKPSSSSSSTYTTSPCSSATNIASCSTVPQIHKDEEIYYPDGNITLVAGSICFRVHQSLLAKHSTVFDDMFSIPQPKDQDMFDGAPRVDLQDDADAVRALLRLIYEPLYVSASSVSLYNAHSVFFISTSPFRTWLSQPSTKTTDQMVGILNLAFKYDMEALRKEITQHLVSSYPRTLEEWDNVSKKREMFSDMPRLDPASTIRMARIADLPDALPLAYYTLIQTYPRRNNNLNEDDDEYVIPDPGEAEVMARLLDRHDLAAIALGREEMTKWVSQRARKCFRTWQCPAPSKTRGQAVCSQRIHLRWAEMLEDVMMRRDVLEVMREHSNWGTGTFGMIFCSDCQSRYVDIMRQMRKDFFKDLPKMFGL